MCRPAVIPCLVLLAITFEPLSDFKNLGHFENPLGKGYMMLSTRKKSKKKCDLPLKKKTHLFDHVIHFKIFITWIISAKMLYLIEVRQYKLIDATLLPNFGFKTHIFKKKSCFLPFAAFLTI